MNQPELPNPSSNLAGADERAEQWLRISELQNRVRELNGGDFLHQNNCTHPDVVEAFWNSVLDSMQQVQVTIASQLSERGFVPPKFEEVPEEETFKELWRVIRAMAEIDIYLCGTDRFSDRDLLKVLLEGILPSETQDQSREDRRCVLIDLEHFSTPEFPSEMDVEMGGSAEWEIELDPRTLRARRPRNKGKGRDGRLPGPPDGRSVVFEGY